jgi:hypothetical protein
MLVTERASQALKAQMEKALQSEHLYPTKELNSGKPLIAPLLNRNAHNLVNSLALDVPQKNAELDFIGPACCRLSQVD